MSKTINPYHQCPVLTTEHFVFRLVEIEDSEDLLACYSDPKAQKLFNTDNFPTDCRIYTIDEMKKYIEFWLMEFSQEAYVRFCIVDKSTNKAIGTIEMFGMIGKYKTDPGILRIDIASDYENKYYFEEILIVCVENFYDLFGVSVIATKAIPQAVNRVDVLHEIGFHAGDIHGSKHYFLRSKQAF
ncbi:MAG: GNAT family N-acetyltransferase [Oscillospiraceae bacterium]|jgi:RimJ/RimL family protein N-acetyltransferase|nr:GNAT family N-acetyltransferase [Oscillospiraceae bacterium]